MKVGTQKRHTMRLLVELDAPNSVPFAEIRKIIIKALESASAGGRASDPLFNPFDNVRLSKPITPWREPQKTPLVVVKLVKGDER